jgi:hypothetical protein
MVLISPWNFTQTAQKSTFLCLKSSIRFHQNLTSSVGTWPWELQEVRSCLTSPMAAQSSAGSMTKNPVASAATGFEAREESLGHLFLVSVACIYIYVILVYINYCGLICIFIYFQVHIHMHRYMYMYTIAIYTTVCVHWFIQPWLTCWCFLWDLKRANLVVYFIDPNNGRFHWKTDQTI